MKMIYSVIRIYSISDDNYLFDQTVCVIKYVTDDAWNDSAIETGKWWIEVFQHFDSNQIEFGDNIETCSIWFVIGRHERTSLEGFLTDE